MVSNWLALVLSIISVCTVLLTIGAYSQKITDAARQIKELRSESITKADVKDFNEMLKEIRKDLSNHVKEQYRMISEVERRISQIEGKS